MGLPFTDYGARQYDARTGRWFGLDPLAGEYPSIGPYAFCGNNPIKFIDPNGEDYIISIDWDDDGNVAGITVKGRTYITGPEASAQRAKELMELAKNTFKSRTVNGVKISFNVQYIYKENMSASDLQPGENLLNFVSESGRSHIGGQANSLGYSTKTGNQGTIFSGGDDLTVMHETGHLLGLSDRYDEYDLKLPIYDRIKSHVGYEKDLMGAGTSLDPSHYRHYLEFMGLPVQGNRRVDNRLVDRNSKGLLKTPYEKGGYHDFYHYNGYKPKRR